MIKQFHFIYDFINRNTNPIISLCRNNFGLIYLTSLSIQIILIAHYVIHTLHIPTAHYSYIQSSVIYFNKHKPIELAEYLLSAALLGIFFTAILITQTYTNKFSWCKRNVLLKKVAEFENIKASLTSLFLITILPAAIFSIHATVAIKLLLQLVLFLANINIIKIYTAVKYKRYDYQTVFNIKNTGFTARLISVAINKRAIYWVFIILAFAQFSSLLYEPIIGRPKFINEFFNIPEQTILPGGEVVDNTTFWNEHIYSRSTHKWDVTSINQFDDFSDCNKSVAATIEQLTQSIPTEEGKTIRDFLLLNQYELQRQIHSRFMFHHQSFMYIPIGEMALGRDWKEITAQYGLGSAWIFGKVLSYFQNVSIDGWLKLSYSSYWVYLILYFGIILRITKDIRLTVIATIGAIALINYRQYELLIMPPGDAPWRHLLDIVVLYFVYCFGEKKKVGYLLVAILLAVVSIVINPEIGLMIFTATLLAGLLSLLQANHVKKFKLSVVTICVSGVAVAVPVLHYLTSQNRLARYYVDGVLGLPISDNELFTILCFFALMYVLLINLFIKNRERNLIHIFWLFLYSQEIFLYVVWHFYHVGFFVRSYIYLLLIIMLANYTNESNKLKIQKFYFLILLGVLAFYFHSVALMSQDKKRFDNVFLTHKTYVWNFEKAKIISTMDPSIFENGIDLIKKYEDANKGIYIISEYDNILPFLANQFSLMPFFDLKWSHVTENEILDSIKLIKKDKPKYLFVDTAVNRQLDREIIDIATPELEYLSQESEWRVQRLQSLYKIFKVVEKDYVLQERGNLISVYRRRDSDNN